MTTYNFASTGVFVDPLKCDPGELCGICGGRGVYGTPGKACPNCSEKAQNLQAEHVADLEIQLTAVTAENAELEGAIELVGKELQRVTAERDALRVDAERYESLLKRCAAALEMTPTKWRNGEHIALPGRIKAAIDAARGAK
jgi:hypothetical protein